MQTPSYCNITWPFAPKGDFVGGNLARRMLSIWVYSELLHFKRFYQYEWSVFLCAERWFFLDILKNIKISTFLVVQNCLLCSVVQRRVHHSNQLLISDPIGLRFGGEKPLTTWWSLQKYLGKHQLKRSCCLWMWNPEYKHQSDSSIWL